jgi:ANTAR domain
VSGAGKDRHVMDDRRLRILTQLSASGERSIVQLCATCVNVTGTSGAGVMLMFGRQPLGSVGMTNAVSALIEELQFTLGEGPCVDAYNYETPIAEPDLGESTRAWMGFTQPVRAAGVGAIFSFPLRSRTVCIGALDLYRDQAGELSYDEHADAVVLANIVTEFVLAMQADAPAGTMAAELTRVADERVVMHQAVGMVAAQLEVRVDEALIRLRAYAFASDRPLSEIAEDVVQRRLRFDLEPGARDPQIGG